MLIGFATVYQWEQEGDGEQMNWKGKREEHWCLVNGSLWLINDAREERVS